jgi:hypothetical protein
VIRSLCCVLSAITVAACTTPVKPLPPPPTAQPQSVEALAAAVQSASTRSDQETQSGARSELAAQASRDANSCISQQPQAAPCLYSKALALGLEARAHPTKAGEFLSGMLDFLKRAEAADANYDEAGPARVRALVLIRAPGWPLGPGDAEEGVTAARRALALRPKYPPNLLALAEGCAKTGDNGCARDNYTHARDAASTMAEGADRAAWLQQADAGLQRHAP